MKAILIVSDTLRRDFLGVYGNKWISTPNIDKLGKISFVFDHAYCASFPTVPARRDILLGKYTFLYSGWEPLRSNEVTVAQILGENGYTTMLIADTPHFLRDGFNYQRGFTGWKWIRGQENDDYITDEIKIELPCDPSKLRCPDTTVVQYFKNISQRVYEEDYFSPKTFSEAIRWLEKNYRREKFFLYIDTFDPHEPWDPPRWYVDMYDPDYKGEEVIYPRYDYSDYLTPEEMKHIRALYAGEVTLVDRWLGRFLTKVEDLGLLKNTLIIFTTDHGFLHGEHGFIGKSIIRENKFAYIPLYEEIAHIPLLMYVPGEKPRRVKDIVQLPDIPSTILDWAGIGIPEDYQGYSLLQIIKGKVKKRKTALSSPPLPPLTTGTRITLTTKEWSCIIPPKYTKRERGVELSVDGKEKEAMEEIKVFPELYNLRSDPQQKYNLLEKEKEVARQLHTLLIKELQNLQAKEEIIENWREAFTTEI